MGIKWLCGFGKLYKYGLKDHWYLEECVLTAEYFASKSAKPPVKFKYRNNKMNVITLYTFPFCAVDMAHICSAAEVSK